MDPRTRFSQEARTHLRLRLLASLFVCLSLGFSATVLLSATGLQVPTQPADEARFRRAAELAGQALADLEEGRCTIATEKFLAVDRLLPNNLLPKINLAICYSMLDQRQKALDWLEKARRLSADNPQTLFATARLLEPLLTADAKALELWKDSLDRFERSRPRDPRPHYLRATVAQQESDYSAALAHLQQALQRSPENLALLLSQLTASAESALPEETEDALNALEDRLNGFDPRAQQYADQLRAAVASSQPKGLRPPALILQNLLRPTDLYRVGLTELVGRGDGTQLFAQLDFEPPLPPSIQGGQDIDVAWVESTVQWLGSLQKQLRAAAGRDGVDDSVWLTALNETIEIVGATDAPARRTLPAIATAKKSLPDQALLVDMNQDGVADLVTLHGRTLRIAHRTSQGSGPRTARDTASNPSVPHFEPPTSVTLPEANQPNARLRMVAGDVDQEGDLDLLVLRTDGPTLFLQNRGSGGLVVTALDLGQTAATDARIVDLDDDGDLDIVLVSTRGITVLDNLRGGSYRDKTVEWLPENITAKRVEVADFNNDGRFDLVSWGGGQQTILLNTPEGFKSTVLPFSESTTWSALTVFDFDNDGDEDLAFSVANSNRIALLRNRRDQGFAEEALSSSQGKMSHRVTDLIPADFDLDGDLDVLAVGEDGARVFRNDGGSTNQWLRVRLQGLYDNNSKNNIQGLGTKVEVRSGGAYQAKLGNGRVLHFGLGSNRRAEVMRVIWTNGLAQTQQQVSSRQTLLEKQVLKGSCPFLYTWTGEQFEFHTDLMWRSTLGMTFSDGSPAPHQSARDWILIPGDRLVPAAGKYWLNTTAELWETIYLDRQELLVVDHPANVQLVVDETFSAPPHPTTAPLHWIRQERPPASAMNHRGKNVLPELLERDELRVGDLPLTRYQGATHEHFIDLTFEGLAKATEKKLLLWGWIFPTDTSINVALAQDPGLSTAPPRLEVLGEDSWRVLIPSLGLPMGKRKAMVIEFDHLLTAAERNAPTLRLRVISTVQIYWNKASLGLSLHVEDTQVNPRITRLDPVFADLHYRGFSAQLPREPDAPHLFDYSRVSTQRRFRDLEGAYTAYGGVVEQISKSDNSFAIMNAGDELSFAYEASKVPALPEGWVRNFVLFTDGWVKDADLHTKFSQTVHPLPFHQMTSYPDGTKPTATPDRRNSRQVSEATFTDALRSSSGSNPQP